MSLETRTPKSKSTVHSNNMQEVAMHNDISNHFMDVFKEH